MSRCVEVGCECDSWASYTWFGFSAFLTTTVGGARSTCHAILIGMHTRVVQSVALLLYHLKHTLWSKMSCDEFFVCGYLVAGIRGGWGWSIQDTCFRPSVFLEIWARKTPMASEYAAVRANTGALVPDCVVCHL